MLCLVNLLYRDYKLCLSGLMYRVGLHRWDYNLMLFNWNRDHTFEWNARHRLVFADGCGIKRFSKILTLKEFNHIIESKRVLDICWRIVQSISIVNWSHIISIPSVGPRLHLVAKDRWEFFFLFLKSLIFHLVTKNRWEGYSLKSPI